MSFDASSNPDDNATPIAENSHTVQGALPEQHPAKVSPLPMPKPLSEDAAVVEAATQTDAAKTMSAPLKPAAPKPAASSLDTIKREELLVQVAGKMRDYIAVGKSEADAVAQLIMEYDALSAALNPHADAMKSASAALAKALNSQIADAHCHIPVSEAVKTMHGIFTKRQIEAQTSRALLSDKAFMDKALQMAQPGAELKATHWFTDAKKEETIAELVSDSPAHTLGNAIGQHTLHKALADVFRLDGPLQSALSKSIQNAAPAMAPDAAIATAKHWLHARFHRADTLAKETKPGAGSLYVEAMKRAEAKVHSTKTALPMSKQEAEIAAQVETALADIAATPAALPVALTQTPAQHAGTVAAAPALSQTVPAL